MKVTGEEVQAAYDKIKPHCGHKAPNQEHIKALLAVDKAPGATRDVLSRLAQSDIQDALVTMLPEREVLPWLRRERGKKQYQYYLSRHGRQAIKIIKGEDEMYKQYDMELFEFVRECLDTADKAFDSQTTPISTRQLRVLLTIAARDKASYSDLMKELNALKDMVRRNCTTLLKQGWIEEISGGVLLDRELQLTESGKEVVEAMGFELA